MYPSLSPAMALIAGIAILAQPKFLNYIVAIYLIVVGALGLAPHFRDGTRTDFGHCGRYSDSGTAQVIELHCGDLLNRKRTVGDLPRITILKGLDV